MSTHLQAKDYTLTQIEIFEKLLNTLDVKFKNHADYSSNDSLNSKQKRSDEKIAIAVAKLSIFINGLSEEDYETLCILAGRNKSGKHDPLNQWWNLFSLEHRDICHNQIAKDGKNLIGIMKENLLTAPR